MNRQSRFAAVFGAALLAGLQTGTAHAQALQEVTIGLGSGSFAGGSGQIVKELGLFEKNGLDAKVVVLGGGSVAMAGLLSGSYKIVVSGFTELLAAKAQGQDVLGVAPAYTGLGVSVVLEKKLAEKLGGTRQPLEARIKALNGLLIASTQPLSVNNVSIKAAAESMGVNIRFTYMEYNVMLPALVGGNIQGYTGAAPFWALGIADGTTVEWINLKEKGFPSDFVPTMSSALGTRGDVAKAEPELVRKVAKSFADLAIAVKERPNDVKAAIKKFYPTLSPEMIDILFEAEAPSWRSDPITVDQVKHEIAYLKKAGLAPAGIDKVDPETVPFR